MDVYGCSAPLDWVDHVFMWITVVGLFLSVVLGLPFIIWVGLVGQYL